MGLKSNVVVDDNVILKIITRPDYAALFPEIKNLASKLLNKSGGCLKCGDDASAKQQVFNAAKAILATLPPDRQKALKTTLNAKSITIVYRGNKGITTTKFT